MNNFSRASESILHTKLDTDDCPLWMRVSDGPRKGTPTLRGDNQPANVEKRSRIYPYVVCKNKGKFMLQLRTRTGKVYVGSFSTRLDAEEEAMLLLEEYYDRERGNSEVR